MSGGEERETQTERKNENEKGKNTTYSSFLKVILEASCARVSKV